MNVNGWLIFLIVAVVIAAILFAMYYFGDKQQKKAQESRQQLIDNMQVVSMLVIDKKHMALKDAGFPKAVMEQIPKRNQRAKAAVVKAKIGNQICSLLCDDNIYDEVPVKAEIKAQISGIYIMGIKNTRNVAPPEPEKKGFFQKLGNKANNSISDEIDRSGDLKAGKNAKNMQPSQKSVQKNKAYNPSTKKRSAGGKKSTSKKRKKHR